MKIEGDPLNTEGDEGGSSRGEGGGGGGSLYSWPSP